MPEPNTLPQREGTPPDTKGAASSPIVAFATSLEADAHAMKRDQELRTLDLVLKYDPRDERSFRIVLTSALNVLGKSEQIASLLDVTVSTLNRWVAGKAIPIQLARLGTALVLEALLREKITGEALDKHDVHRRFKNEADKLATQNAPAPTNQSPGLVPVLV